MNLPVVWLPEAEAELTEALAWYEAVSPQLAARFALAVSETVDLLADAPQHFAVIHKGIRRAGIRRFPYGLFFLLEEVRVVVIACFHGKRNPRKWQRRALP